MATSQKTFDQVKNILGRLDRSIDSLREQRTGVGLSPAGAPAVAGAPAPRAMASPVSTHAFGPDHLIGLPKPMPVAAPQAAPLTPFSQPTPNAARSPWGRAQPLRRDAGEA